MGELCHKMVDDVGEGRNRFFGVALLGFSTVIVMRLCGFVVDGISVSCVEVQVWSSMHSSFLAGVRVVPGTQVMVSVSGAFL